jgi:predicted nucleotidyltransferase
MVSRKNILDFLSQNKDHFKDQYHIIRIGLFGSFTRNEQIVLSDIDLVVEFEENTQNLYDLKRALKAYVREKLNIEVDIAREKYLKPRYKKSIIKETYYVELGSACPGIDH